MAEGFYRSREAQPSGAGISERIDTDATYTADAEMPGQSRQHAGARVAETAPEASAAPARSILKRPLLLTYGRCLTRCCGCGWLAVLHVLHRARMDR